MNRLLQMGSDGGRAWTDEDIKTAARMYAHRWDGYGARKSAIAAIAEALKRSDESVASRLRHCGETFRRPPHCAESDRRRSDYRAYPHRQPQNNHVATPRRADIPDDVLADREHRALLEHDTLTAAFFGDPLPGYSMRERR